MGSKRTLVVLQGILWFGILTAIQAGGCVPTPPPTGKETSMSQPSPKLHEINVHVTGPDGQKVSGAVVGGLTWSEAKIDDATTRDGVAVLRVASGTELNAIVARKGGDGFDYWLPPGEGRPVKPTLDLPKDVNLVLKGAKTVTVKVVDTEGKPVGDFAVTLWIIRIDGKREDVNLSGWKGGQVKTDSRGLAKFDWLPANQIEVAWFSDYNKGFSTLERASLTATAPDGTEQSITAYRSGTLSGKVTFPDGKGAPGILVQIEGGACSNYMRDEVRTGPDGTYSIEAWPERSYLVAVLDDRWTAQTQMGIDVAQGQHRQGVDLKLIEGSIITGRYTIGPDRRPGVDETITLTQIGPEPAVCRKGGACGPDSLVRWAKTDKDGRYRFRAGPGKYHLDGPGWVERAELVVADEPMIERDFHRQAPVRGDLAGQVVRKSGGAPVSGASVKSCSSHPSHEGLDTRCDAKGEFAQDRWNDRMLIWASSPDGSLAGTAEIRETDTRTRVEVVPAVVAEVRVVDPNGKPVAGADVMYWMKTKWPDGAEAQFQVQTRTDASGLVRMPGLLPGTQCTVGAMRAIFVDDLPPLKFAAQTGPAQVLHLSDIVLPPAKPATTPK